MTFLLIVTVSSMVLAGIMSVIAWRIAAEERRRSDARIAALAAEIHAPAAPRAMAAQSAAARVESSVRGETPRLAPFPLQRRAAGWEEDLPIRPAADFRTRTPDLFAQHDTRRRGPLVAVASAIAVAAALAILVFLGRGLPRRVSTSPAPAAPTVPIAAASPAPLELLALGHDRDGDRLTVRGIVRNPSSAAPTEPLMAVVLVFTGDGGFLTSSRGIIEPGRLRPGAESTFAVAVPNASAVARYRVSFRSGDRIVPHVDRREPPKVSP